MEVTAAQLKQGDRILALRDFDDHTPRQANWVVKAPLGLVPVAQRVGIQLEPQPTDYEGYEFNLWPGTDYTSDAVFIIDRT